MAIVNRVEFSDLAFTKRKPATALAKRRAINADGYATKYPSDWLVRIPGSNAYRRIYICQISNASTAYVLVGKDWCVVSGVPA